MLLPLILLAIAADIRGCVCDPAQPGTLQDRACSLTRVAIEQTGAAPVFFVRDANPAKPNRWLAIPRTLHQSLNEMTPAERNVYWAAAIAKARDLWPDNWAIAINGDERRSQCQLHAHIGKLLPEADRSGGVLVDRVEEIPTPPAGSGIWIQPEGNKLRVHPGVMAGETNLMR